MPENFRTTNNAGTESFPHEVTAMMSAAHDLAGAGLSPGSTGNISVKVGDYTYVSSSGSSFSTLSDDDVTVLDSSNTPIFGRKPTKEVPLHAAYYARNPSHHAVIHLHSPYAMAQACLTPWSEYSAVAPLTPYFVMRVGQLPLLPYAQPGSSELGACVEACPYPFFGALLANHGLICGGETISEAYERAIEIETVCRTAYLTQSRDLRPLTSAQARELAERYGTPWNGDE
ncbi:class II aldolase/adducin family protein [Arcanobacterium haemolyticum]|nr:class II aldolase/adducin family protein [Arcanobacterium haemolyticum]